MMPVDSPDSPVASVALSSSSRRKPAALHRCRFPDWSPTPVAALSITPPSFDTAALGFGGTSAERGVLAVGRASGDVELMCWGGHQGWIAWRTTLSPSDLSLYAHDLPGAEREVNRLQSEGVRLFGVGGTGSELVEWEWGGPGGKKEVGRIKSTLPTLPPIFALAASRSSSHLAIACEDSTIRILSILDDELELVGKIEVGGPGKVRALSLAWGFPGEVAPEADEEEGDAKSVLPPHFATPLSTTLIAGLSNSTLVTLSSATPALSLWSRTHRMTVDKVPGEATVVWAVAVLPDDTAVSGDSMGNVKFWDLKMGTQKESWRAGKADILCLAVGSDGTTVFTSGVDQRTTEFRKVAITSSRSNNKTTSRWIQSSGRRLHAHDVRAMVISPPFLGPLPASHALSTSSTKHSKAIVPVLTSAGLDLSLVTVCASASSTPALHNPISETVSTEFETTIHRKASYVPQRGQAFAVAREARLLVARRPRGVGIWRVSQSAMSGSGAGKAKWRREEEEDEKEEGWGKVAELELKLQTNLVASAVSSDGKWLAVSDLYETKLFRLSLKNGQVSPHRQKTFSTSLSDSLPTSLGTGSSALAFSPDSSTLVLATAFGSYVAVIGLPKSGGEDFDVKAVWGDHAVRSSKGRETRGRGGKANGKTNGVNGVAHDESDEEESDEDEEMEVDGEAVKGDKPATVACLSVSQDGKWLASADLERKVCVFDLEGLKHFTTLPTPSQVPTTLSFLPTVSSSNEPTLLLAYPNNSLSLFGLTTHRFLSWSLPLSSLRSNTLMDIREPLIGVTFESQPTKSREENGMGKVHESRRALVGADLVAVVWGANWVARIDLAELREGKVAGKSVRRDADRKRARDEKEGVSGVEAKEVDIKVTRKYSPLVLFDFIGHGELVAVEKVWADLARGMPDAFVRNAEFGT
ncbi:U3 small nucleolar RNA-associated protein 4 [Pseudohyphozyma bogoriensis]|nr:U3 small nucleolar RNA-associated protein 4 [Pseudohyphozyma bogoriensis]